MGTVTVRLDRDDGTYEELPLELNLETLTMREAVRLEEILGVEAYTELVTNGIDGASATSARLLRGVLYVKLKTLRPDVELDAFDLDLNDLQAALEAPAPLGEDSGGGSKV